MRSGAVFCRRNFDWCVPIVLNGATEAARMKPFRTEPKPEKRRRQVKLDKLSGLALAAPKRDKRTLMALVLGKARETKSSTTDPRGQNTGSTDRKGPSSVDPVFVRIAQSQSSLSPSLSPGKWQCNFHNSGPSRPKVRVLLPFQKSRTKNATQILSSSLHTYFTKPSQESMTAIVIPCDRFSLSSHSLN